MNWTRAAGALTAVALGSAVATASVLRVKHENDRLRKLAHHRQEQHLDLVYQSSHLLDEYKEQERATRERLRSEYRNLSNKKQRLISVIGEEFGVGPDAKTWTTKDAAEVSGISENTVRSYIFDLKDTDWIEETGEKRNRAKLYRLAKSRKLGRVPE